MPPFLLKTIRFFVPAGLLYFLLVGICWFSHWCEVALPSQYEEITKSILALILGYAYSVSYLRELSNSKYFEMVNQNICNKLITPFAGDPNVPKDLPWSRVRHVFYRFVDADESLKHQKTLAYWNGALWTSAADLRAVSALGCVITGILLLGANIFGDARFDTIRATYFFLLMVALFAISIPLSILTTRRHMEIGTQQCEFIVAQYRSELRAKLIAAAS